ncbi:hypothetical protein [Brevibacterium sp. RIT 803]|uniref:hypothetical protein n=1 Tax=Brevibacterium sp. RIT 803 TaxID=2810210 RepID=UPI00195090F1|nr:hypothetical protein [Brevibacterium sp. RIT 803]MBM6589388.1 hypothetical protein [Brevibacterium sp. RIT 803]
MKVVFQGAGAIGLAAAALFGRRHEAVVVSRSESSTSDAVRARSVAYPRRVRSLGNRPMCREAVLGQSPARRGTVQGTGPARRVSVVDWAAVSSESWDLVVLTTRPGDLDDGVAASIVALRPGIIAITSQVDGDRSIAASMFPDSEILVFSPVLLSERTTGRTVSYWHPPGMPVFMASGRRGTVRGLRRRLGGLIVGVPAFVISAPPAVFIPYVAELSAREGNWASLRSHLRRPSRAAAEAVHAVTGVRMPMSDRAAGLVLDALERFVPIDVSEYAGRHFGRHEGQTLDMLDGWLSRAAERTAARAQRPTPAMRRSPTPTPAMRRSPTPTPVTGRSPVPAQSSALRELAQALRLRVTR